MLYDEDNNKYVLKRELKRNCFFNYLPSVSEYGEYISVNLNIKNIRRYEFKGYMLMLVLDGAGIISIRKQIFPLSFGDLLIVDSNSEQVISNNLWKVCYIIIQGENLYKLFSDAFQNNHLFYFENIEILYEKFQNIYHSLDEDIYSSLCTASLIYELLSEILEAGQKRKIPDYFERLISCYIENHYMEDIGINDMASICGYSTYYFIEKFKKIFGITPYNFLTQRRLQAAKYLLKSKNYSIEEIARKTGFQSHSSFCITFKNFEHITPRAYRSQMKEGYLYGKQSHML